MKKRRLAIVSFLMLAVLVMGIGFAAVADNLNITGAARVLSDETAVVFDEKVYFSAAVVNAGTVDPAATNDTIEITGTQKDAIEFHVNSIALINEFTQFKITIKNESEQYNAEVTIDGGQPTGSITNPAAADFDDYFTITYSTKADSVDADPIVCAAGGTVDVYVTVTLKCSPDEIVDANFTSHLTATSQKVTTP